MKNFESELRLKFEDIKLVGSWILFSRHVIYNSGANQVTVSKLVCH